MPPDSSAIVSRTASRRLIWPSSMLAHVGAFESVRRAKGRPSEESDLKPRYHLLEAVVRTLKVGHELLGEPRATQQGNKGGRVSREGPPRSSGYLDVDPNVRDVRLRDET